MHELLDLGGVIGVGSTLAVLHDDTEAVLRPRHHALECPVGTVLLDVAHVVVHGDEIALHACHQTCSCRRRVGGRRNQQGILAGVLSDRLTDADCVRGLASTLDVADHDDGLDTQVRQEAKSLDQTCLERQLHAVVDVESLGVSLIDQVGHEDCVISETFGVLGIQDLEILSASRRRAVLVAERGTERVHVLAPA